MAPQNKTTSSSGFVYELNNFTACVNTADAPHEFQNMSYAMTAAPILFCEVVEEVWSTTVYNLTDKVITFSLKGNLYSINYDVLNSFLNLPNKTHAQSPTETELGLCLMKLIMMSMMHILVKLLGRILGRNGGISLIVSLRFSQGR